MKIITVEKVQDLLRSAYPARSQVVPCLIGAPGIGKTEGIQAFADEIGVNLVTFILSNTIPSEVSGIRMPDKDTKKLEVFDDARMASLKDGDILFLDEILEAPRELWTACLTLIQNRVMASGRPLPDIMIVAASNPLRSPNLIPSSVRDRFMFVQVGFDKEQWAGWFESKYGKRPKEGLVNRIEANGTSDEYNILTPRRVEKLCAWYCKAPDKQVVVDAIDAMFDRYVAEAIEELCIVKGSFVDALKSELTDIGVPDSVIESSRPAVILDSLKELDEWPEIEEKLASIEFVEDSQTTYIM